MASRTIPAEGDLLTLAIAWWLAHMRRDPEHLTSVGIDGAGCIHFVWELDDGPQPYDLPVVDLLLWQWTGDPTKIRSL